MEDLGDTIKHPAHLASDPWTAFVFAERGEDKKLANVSLERVEGFSHGDFGDFAQSGNFGADVFSSF